MITVQRRRWCPGRASAADALDDQRPGARSSTRPSASADQAPLRRRAWPARSFDAVGHDEQARRDRPVPELARDRQDAHHERELPATNAANSTDVRSAGSVAIRLKFTKRGHEDDDHERSSRPSRRRVPRTSRAASLKISASEQADHDGPPTSRSGEFEVDLFERSTRTASSEITSWCSATSGRSARPCGPSTGDLGGVAGDVRCACWRRMSPQLANVQARRPSSRRRCRLMISCSGACATTPALADHDHVVGGLGALGERGRKTEHRPAFRRQGPAKSRASGSLRVEAVRGSSSTRTSGRRAAPPLGRAAGACRATTAARRCRASLSATSSSSSSTRWSDTPDALARVRRWFQPRGPGAAPCRRRAPHAHGVHRVSERPRERRPEHGCGAGRRDSPTQQHSQCGCLPGPIGPQKSHDAPLVREREIVDGYHGPELLSESATSISCAIALM